MKKEKYEILLKVIDRWKIDIQTGTITTRKGISKVMDKNGYLSVSTTYKGKKYYFKHHQVIIVKAGLNPVGKTINHINGIKTDNSIDNLEIVTHKDNMMHAFKTGLKVPYNKIPEETVQLILDKYDGIYGSQTRLAKELGLHPETVRRTIKRNKKKVLV